MANNQTMSFQRAWKRTRAVQREIERANPENEVVSSAGGYMIVRQAAGGYTLQRGLRVRFDPETDKPWTTREEAEAAAMKLTNEHR